MKAYQSFLVGALFIVSFAGCAHPTAHTAYLALSETNFYGLNLKDAPCSDQFGDLPDLWERNDEGAWSWRAGVHTTKIPNGGQYRWAVHYLRKLNRFYVSPRWGLPPGGSVFDFTVYGPFDGNPQEVLGIDQ